MSDLFWSMHEELKQTMVFKRSKTLGLLTWAFFPFMIGYYIGLVVGDTIARRVDW